MRPHPTRATLYAIDRANNEILFVDLHELRVVKKLYVGKDPSDLDIDVTGDFLYIANKGPGTGAPGSDRIAMVDLNTGTLVKSWILPSLIENLTAGRAGKIYYNGGEANYGLAYSFDVAAGGPTEFLGYIKTRMVISSDKRLLYGQRIYEGNLGEMGVFDVSAEVRSVDSLRYPPYPYGWGPNNYCLSANDRVLGFGPILFNATNLLDQIGLLKEYVYALNDDASLAFGETSIWNTSTFAVNGDATKVTNLPFSSTLMRFASRTQTLFAFNPGDKSIHLVEETTPNLIPFQWLRSHHLSVEDSIESNDKDGDGFSVLQEWILDSDPEASTKPVSIALEGAEISFLTTSPDRTYTLESCRDLSRLAWEEIETFRGVADRTVIHPLELPQAETAVFRVKVSLH